MKVDCHTHTSERSHCGRSPARDMVRAAVNFGLDALFMTDHNRLAPPEDVAALNEEFAPFRIFGGIEVTVIEKEDIIVLGVEEPSLESGDWPYAELHAFVRDKGGLLTLAHPFRYRSEVLIDVAAMPPDFIELHSINIGACDEEQIRELAQNCGSSLIHESDAHEDTDVAIFHTELEGVPLEQYAILEALRQRRFSNLTMQPRVEERNALVDAWEDDIREALAAGKDADYYVNEMGGNRGRFERVQRGGSYRI